ncbi:ABC transporter permease [Aquimarina sp. D1M17]|uniref:ABC transporter permease n=1 Tax=Aquimarina acroporae TaxID=2937283 RepID=UPI0020BE9F19|nr:FtsX-like permease family protein [Aquimarina acroporae]MCK8522364.1 ABC transporter permease [Aquimarina acroporae]
MNYLKLALRNIARHKKRSIVTIMTIALGFTALGVIGGIVNNIFSRLKEQAIIGEKLGHLTLAKKGYFEYGKMNPEEYVWGAEDLNKILSIINKNPEVTISTPRLSLFGVVSNGKSSTIFITEAIVPQDDKKLVITDVDGRSGSLQTVSLDTEGKDRAVVAIGSELSENLNIKKGENLTLLVSTIDGITNAVDVEVGHIYNTGNPATNDKFILSNFYMAQELYDTKGAERIIVTIKDPENIYKVKEQLIQDLNVAGYEVSSKVWSEVSLTYSKVKKMFGIIFRVLTIIITVIVLLTLLNTMQMSVAERTREIGTLRAIGLIKRRIIYLFCLEGLIMGILGCAIAVPILLLITFILKSLKVSFIPPVASTEVPIELIIKMKSVLPVLLLFCLASLVSSFIASRKITGQNVVKSLITIN